MRIKEEQFFHAIATECICDSVVILDVDGTLTCGSCTEVRRGVADVVQTLQKYNSVYVFSNNYDNMRSRAIAARLHVPYITAPHKKPHPKILNYIDTEARPVVIIGDKYLTDGLFAHFTHAKHVRVKRYQCARDSFFHKATCLFDDAVYVCAKILRVVRVQ